jgi:hypothetical protein
VLADTNWPASNGLVLYPNTFFWQEMVRKRFDNVLDRKDAGHQVESPFIYTIPKGQ